MKLKYMRGKLLLTGLLLVFAAMFLAACGGKGNQEELNRPPVTEAQADTKEEKAERSEASGVKALEDVNALPSDGIITKEQFATVAGQNREIRFTGESEEGIRYTWTYNAAQIQNPEDQNLKITFDLEDLDDIKQQANHANDALRMTMHDKSLICPPTLTVEIPEAWQSDTGMLLKEQDSKLAKMSDVTIKSEPSSDAASDSVEEGAAQDAPPGDNAAQDAPPEDNTARPSSEIKSLTEPVEGRTTFTMTVLSLDGDSYIVGGITNVDKLAAINQQAQAIASANANPGTDANAGYADAGDGGAGFTYDENAYDGSSPSYSDDYGSQPADVPANAGNSGGSGGSSSGSSGNGVSGSGGSGNSSKGKTGSGGSGGSGGGTGSSSGGSSAGASSGGNSAGANSGGSGNTCTLSINCSTILNNKKNLTKGKEEFVPSDGWILKPTTVTFSAGESVHDILQRVCREQGIHMESSFTPAYNSAYVEGINQLYEFDCGQLSGWMYSVNGWFPNYGCSKYTVAAGDVINWVYTCDLGKDVGGESAVN